MNLLKDLNMNSVFICTTIFQLFLTKKIISQEHIINSKVFFFSSNFNCRVKKLIEDCDFDVHVVSVKGNFNKVKFFNEMKRNIDFYKSLYVSSIDDMIIRTIVSLFYRESKDVFTFDDGISNHFNYFKTDTKKSFVKKLFFRLNGNTINCLNDFIFNDKSYHFTINDELPNLHNSLKRIDLNFDFYDVVSNKFSNVNIFVAPFFDELFVNPKTERDFFISEAAKKNAIIIPHPRDNFDWSFLNNKIPKDITVSEDFILNFVSKGILVYLFSYASGTQVNLSKVNNIKNIILPMSGMKPDEVERYNYKFICDFLIKNGANNLLTHNSHYEDFSRKLEYV